MSVSTHVLDTSLGRPAPHVAVRVMRRDAEQWTEISRHATNVDGRVAALTQPGSLVAAGTYRLLFDVGAYFEQRGIESFYREIVIEFIVRDAAEHYHVPLLVSPFGYSTYRGS